MGQAVNLQVADSSTEEALQGVEAAARKEHVGMWRYGDPGEESDEETDRPKNAWGRR
jgi:endonuclease YncB( thermonuclease family)